MSMAHCANHIIKLSAARSGAAHVLRSHAPDIAGGLLVAPTIGRDQFIDTFCRLLFLAMLGHAGSICITPVVGQAAAFVNGRRACRTDWIAVSCGNRASEGDRAHPESCDRRCQG